MDTFLDIAINAEDTLVKFLTLRIHQYQNPRASVMIPAKFKQRA